MTDISPPRQASTDTARSSGSRWDAPAGYQQLGTAPGSPDTLHADIEIYRSLIAALNEGIVLQR